MRSKLGQLSVETMIIYGLVILIALSVIAGLLYFNVLDIGSYLPESCDIGGTGDLKCEEFGFANNVISLGIRNNGQKSLELLTVQATDIDGIHFTGTPSASGQVNGAVITSTNPLAPGAIADVEISTGGTAKPGRVLRARLETSYKYKDGAITSQSAGDLRVKASG